MLKISPQQFEIFQDQAEDQFVKKIQPVLAEKYPQLFSAFPKDIQIKIVRNMIDRTKRWGISWKSSIVIFAELMITIAPNFDEQINIKDALESNRDQVNQTIKSITDHVPEIAWSQAEAEADDLPLYLSSNLLNTSLIDQTASAIPLVLWDQAIELDNHHSAENAFQYATELGLNNVPDAPLTLVVWKNRYGKEFNNPSVNPWVTDILDHNRKQRERIAMLKYRIALDHGRRV